MPLVTGVVAPRRGSRRRVVYLDDQEWRTTSADVLKPLGIKVGSIAPLDELERAIDEAEPVRARERALRLLTYRERSATELAARLAEDAFPQAVAAAVVADLERVGLVDDERFARMTARVLTQIRGMGRSRALRELASKGIGPDLAQEVVDEALPRKAEQTAADDLARALACRPKASVDRVAARLLRKGYTPPIALGAAKRACAEHAMEHGDDRWEGDFGDAPDLRESDD
jgi:regulatory protein